MPSNNSKVLRIGTFNVENLFARYQFKEKIDPLKTASFTRNELAFKELSAPDKAVTAAAVRELDADVLCLQEVESLEVLDYFVSHELRGKGYAHPILIDSHDPRRIDVAVLSRHPIADIRTHRQERAGKSFLFSRDCLEVEIAIPGGKLFTIYVNHFKSMMEGRKQTAARRKAQVARVREIVDAGWSKKKFRGNFAVLGDFNDYDDESTSIGELIHHPSLVDVLDLLPREERWTHYYPKADEYRQLDFVLLPKPLVKAFQTPEVTVYRKGQPLRAKRYTGPRLKGIEKDVKASDHCPVLVDIPVSALF